ncbi:MAG: AAA family ATPase [Phycisphaerae bacterium]
MYCSHFGLDRPPFNNTPDPTFYFSTPEHEEALATLQYATEQRKGFVLVTGEVGAGKTLTGRIFLRQIEQQAETAVITNTHLSGHQLLAAICSEFGLTPPPQAGNLKLSQLLQEFLLEQFAQDRYVVVIIDEAQNLPDEAFEEIRMLGNLEADDAKLLQVCILGQPELRERFSQPKMRQLDQRLFGRFHLKALSAQQTRQYIHHRLRVAGCVATDLFADKAIDAIYLASKGIPRLINQICDAALLACYADGRKVVNEEIIQEVCEQFGGVSRDTESPQALDHRTTVEAAATSPRSKSSDAGATVTTGVLQEEATLDTLARSIQECVETVVESHGTTPGITPVDNAETEERCRKAREELARLAGTDFSAQRTDLPCPPGQTTSQTPQRREEPKAQKAVRSPQDGERLADFMNAMKRKSSRIADGKTGKQTEVSWQSTPRLENTERTDQLDKAAAPKPELQAINMLQRQLADSEQAITDLGRHVDSQFSVIEEELKSLERKTAGAEEVRQLKSLHETAASDMERRLAGVAASIEQLSEWIKKRGETSRGEMPPEFEALSKRVIEQAQQLQELRKRTLAQNASVAQILSELRNQAVSRAELDEVRAAQAETGRKILERIDRNRDDTQEILDNLEERYLGLRDQIEALIASKAEASSLTDIRNRHQTDFSELLGALGKQRQDLENKLEQIVADWKKTQKALDDLAAQAGDKRELDEIRRRQAADASRILETLADHRRQVQSLAKDLDRRAGDLLARLNALPKDLATTEQLHDIRAAYTEQITELTARLAACEAGFEKTHALHERGLRAVAGKTLDTARRVAILEEKGRPRRIRLELSPRAGIELGDVVASAQEQRDLLCADIEQASKTAADLREMSSTIREAMQAWQASVEASWDNAQAFLQEWQQKAVEAKGEAERMLDGWRKGTDEVRQEAERLRASARMAAEILQKMRQCHAAIDARLNSEEWHTQISRAEGIATRLEQAVAAGQTICRQIAGGIERSKNELGAYLAECKKQLAKRLAEFAAEQQQMDRVIEARRQMLARIAKSAGSLVEVIDAGRQFDEQRHPSVPADPASKPSAVESRESQAETVAEIRWPRFRTHQPSTQAQAS